MPRIKSVIAGSIAEAGGITPGEELVAIDGERIADIFDYMFQTSSCEPELLLRGADGAERTLRLKKAEDEDIGLIFENALLDEPRQCGNRCIFCFIDQLPAGMRESLYFKDDDIRLTFINGNYVTLTNVSARELSRIAGYRLSPVNVSVHAADAALRARMLGRRDCGGEPPERYDIMPKLKYLAASGIAVNAQIVLCRHYNDGEALDSTLYNLGGLGECMKSISIVPSGLTKFRSGLQFLEAYDADSAKDIIRQISRWQKIFLQKRGSRLVYAADEFYVLSGTRVPGAGAYEGYPQLENGVGMLALFKKQFDNCIYRLKNGKDFDRLRARASDLPPTYIFTGVAAARLIERCVDKIKDMFSVKNIAVVPVENNFFGEKITVTGLLTGRDILKRARLIDFPPNSRILLSKTMLKHDSDMFLDDYTLAMLRNALKIDIISVENSGRALIRALLRL